jgi:hypothetical protein
MRLRVLKAAWLCIIGFVILCIPNGLRAQGNLVVIYRKVMTARSLSALVVVDDQPLPGVLVEETAENWEGTLRSTKTDATGSFSFEPVKGRKIYYFRLTIPNIDVLQVRMRTSVFARKPLKLQMKVAD